MKRASSVTLHDVARLAGVHFSTVSRALDPAKRQMLRADVVDRVVAAATSLRYQKNEAAAGLKTRKSFQINILVPDLGHTAVSPMVAGIRERLVNTSYVAIVGDEKRLVGQERFSLRAMKMRPTGGLIVATAHLRDKFVDEAAVEGIPIVQVMRVTRQRRSSSVVVDHRRGMRAAVGLLHAHGHARIGLICHAPTLSTGLAERAGFFAAMKAVGLPADAAQCEAAPDDAIEWGHQAFLPLRKRNPALTAVIAADDRLALGCIDAAASAGLSCPGQVSVVGFGDLPLVDRMTPSLCTMRVDYARIGRIAAEMMIRTLEDSAAPAVHEEVEPELILRGSVAERGGRAR